MSNKSNLRKVIELLENSQSYWEFSTVKNMLLKYGLLKNPEVEIAMKDAQSRLGKEKKIFQNIYDWTDENSFFEKIKASFPSKKYDWKLFKNANSIMREHDKRIFGGIPIRRLPHLSIIKRKEELLFILTTKSSDEKFLISGYKGRILAELMPLFYCDNGKIIIK